MEIKNIIDRQQKQEITRFILESLPEWFEVEESREQYINDCVDWIFHAAFIDDKPVGFICLKPTSQYTAEIAVMGVTKECHRHGIGRQLFEAARNSASVEGFSFLQVKTVKMGLYEDYDRTNRFYISLGFKELEVLPIWDEANPCQIYIMCV